MISVADLAFELWFADSGNADAVKPMYRKHIFDKLIAAGKPSHGMDRAFRHAVLVLKLAREGAFSQSPVGFSSTDGTVH